MKSRIDPAARKELKEAAEFYERERPELADRLVNEVQRVIQLLSENPELGFSVGSNRRVIVLNRFPFRLVYAVEESVLRIIAVAHQKRRPDYWRGRAEEPRPMYTTLRQAA